MMQIRRMTPEDIPAAAALERECLAEAWSESSYRSAFRLDGTGSWFWLAEENGIVNGIIGLTRMGEDGEIGNVAVRQELRRQGIAGALLETALSYGEMELGMKSFTLEVRDGNAAAIHLYEKAGFCTEGIRPRFYRNPTEDARILWRRR